MCPITVYVSTCVFVHQQVTKSICDISLKPMYIVCTLYMHVHVHEHDMQVANGVHAYKMYNTTRVLCTDVYTCFHGQLTTVYTILLFDKDVMHVYTL